MQAGAGPLAPGFPRSQVSRSRLPLGRRPLALPRWGPRGACCGEQPLALGPCSAVAGAGGRIGRKPPGLPPVSRPGLWKDPPAA